MGEGIFCSLSLEGRGFYGVTIFINELRNLYNREPQSGVAIQTIIKIHFSNNLWASPMTLNRNG